MLFFFQQGDLKQVEKQKDGKKYTFYFHDKHFFSAERQKKL